MGKGYNNYMTKKPFHPGSKANIKRTWMAEQRTENEKRKQEELKVQYEKEQDLYNNRALLSTESKDKLQLNFMYEAPPGAKRERQKEDDEPEYKFEWQRKYNAPREDYAKGNADIRDQPFGIPVRNVRCIKCHKWGHVNTDKECPLFNSASSSSMPTTSMDPLELMRQMREDGYNLKQNVLGHHVNPRLANQQYVHSDEDDGVDPEIEFLRSLTSKQKKKLLKKLNRLSKKQKKKDDAKKKKKHKTKGKDTESSSSETNEEPKKNVPPKNESSSDEEEVNKYNKISKSHTKQDTKHHSQSTAPSTASKTPMKHEKRRKESAQDADESVESKKSKKEHHDSRGKDRSTDSKQKFSKQDSSHKGHKRKKESKRNRDSSSESSEDDHSRRAKKKLPDSLADFKKSKKDVDSSNEDNSSPKKESGKRVADFKKKVRKQDSDSQSSPEKEKRPYKDISDSPDKKQSKPPEKNVDEGDCDALPQPSSGKKHHKSSHRNLGTAADKEDLLPNKKTFSSVSAASESSENVGNIKKSSPSKEDAECLASTSQQLKLDSSSDDDDEKESANFAKPSKSSQRKSPSADRSSPEHPDRFTHRHPQRKRSCKGLEEDPKYHGHSHDRFRDLHRHRRSPSVKHKYKP